jgi:hypothetical protein
MAAISQRMRLKSRQGVNEIVGSLTRPAKLLNLNYIRALCFHYGVTGEDRELLRELRALQKRIRNFQGILFDKPVRKYKACLRHNSGRVEVLGWFDSELDAYKHYRAANAKRLPQRIDMFESPAKVQRLLKLVEACRHEIRKDSLLGSSLDSTRWRDTYETRISTSYYVRAGKGGRE